MNKVYKENILIVDDKSANLLALTSLLTNNNRTIFTADKGEEALKIALNKEIDLIILDVQMPDMDGFEVAQILKSSKKTKDIPIIFATAESKEHKLMMKGYEEGAVDYLFKPIDPEIVKAKVSVLLKIQMQKKELIGINASLEKSALLINNSADIIGIIDIGSFKIEEINNAFTSILGYSNKEALESTLTFFLSDEDRVVVEKLAKQSKTSLSFETRIYCKNRSIKWLQWKVVAKYGKWFANARDITEIKQVEKIRNYLTTVVRQSNDAIYIHDHEGKIISWNEGAEKIYGYSEKEALHMKIWNIIPEYIKFETGEMVNKIIYGSKIQNLETKRITKFGKVVEVLFSASVITDPDNGQKSIAINERDITLQKEADEKVRQLNSDLKSNVIQLELTNQELESFSFSVSHDLRAPLRALNGYSRIIEEEYEKQLSDEVKRLLERIQFNAYKMEVMINDLLEFSKLGKKEIRKSNVNMKELVLTVINEINTSTKHSAVINVDTLPNAVADHALLYHVWINLISNAIKYSSKKDNSQITVGFMTSEKENIYYVKDNGAGFDMNYSDKLFGVFQRLHSPKEFEGTGIGLAIVKRIIFKHGGNVWAEAAVNNGATFYFTLPIIE